MAQGLANSLNGTQSAHSCSVSVHQSCGKAAIRRRALPAHPHDERWRPFLAACRSCRAHGTGSEIPQSRDGRERPRHQLILGCVIRVTAYRVNGAYLCKIARGTSYIFSSELHIFKKELTSCLLAILANKFSAGRRAETRGAPEPISRCTRSLEQALKKSRPRDWPRRLNNKTVATLRAATTNHHPEIPIVVRAIDHAALQRLKALDPDEAFKLTSAALDSAGLTPEHATQSLVTPSSRPSRLPRAPPRYRRRQTSTRKSATVSRSMVICWSDRALRCRSLTAPTEELRGSSIRCAS